MHLFLFRAITPRLTIYVSLDGNNYHAIYLLLNTSKELLQKLFKLPGFYDLMSHHFPSTSTASCNTVGPTSNLTNSSATLLQDANGMQLSNFPAWNMMSNFTAQSSSFALVHNNLNVGVQQSHQSAGLTLSNSEASAETGLKSFLFILGPSGVHVAVTDEVLNNEIQDGSLFTLEVQISKIILKPINKNTN